MKVATKLSGFVLALAATFAAAAGVGQAVGPVGWAETPVAIGHDMSDTGSMTADDKLPGGLMVSQTGFTLALGETSVPAGSTVPLGFRILDPSGTPVTAYERTHDKDLHLIAVRRDLTGFQHVHPTLDVDGTWQVPVALDAGQWRVFADFQPAGADDGLTLGADLAVAGAYDPQPLPEPSAVTTVDGYTVTLEGALVAGSESELTLSVRGPDGEPVTDLEPYLAAYGHLVALRDGDLAYLHVHPAGEPGDGVTPPGPDVTFYAEVPSVGRYALFLDFKHDGVVRTAAFTAEAETP